MAQLRKITLALTLKELPSYNKASDGPILMELEKGKTPSPPGSRVRGQATLSDGTLASSTIYSHMNGSNTSHLQVLSNKDL
mmetsp:Transcript_42977/g.36114  ORF Transcript_42977/g.36114 Transcript_42977/m.36114 type:complete len:81 (-) Transcript_42977:1234-1476(-)